jgi:YD repeat-containing protein
MSFKSYKPSFDRSGDRGVKAPGSFGPSGWAQPIFVAAAIFWCPAVVWAQANPDLTFSHDLSGTPPVDGYWRGSGDTGQASHPDYDDARMSFDEDVVFGSTVGEGLAEQVGGDYGPDEAFSHAVEELAERYTGDKGRRAGRKSHRTEQSKALGQGWASDHGTKLADVLPDSFDVSSKTMVGHNTGYSPGLPPGAAGPRLKEAEQELGNDPVDPASGEYRERRVDIFLPGVGLNLSIARTYSNRYNFHGPLGHGWNHNFNQRIVPQKAACGADVLHWVTGEGTTLEFQPGEEGYRSHPPSPWQLTSEDEGYLLVAHNGIQYRFDTGGYLQYVADLNDNRITVDWEEPEGDLETRVLAVTDTQGRRLSFDYDPRGYLESISNEALEISVEYVVDAFEDLVTVVGPTGVTEEYEYDQGSYEPVDFVPDVALASMCQSLCGLSNDVCGGTQCTDDELIANWQRQCIDECQPTPEECGRTCNRDCGTICAEENDECLNVCDQFCDSCGVNARSECSALLATDSDPTDGEHGVCLEACQNGCDSECARESCVPRVAECLDSFMVSAGSNGGGVSGSSSGKCGFWETVWSLFETLWDSIVVAVVAIWETLEGIGCTIASWFGHECERDRTAYDLTSEYADEWCTQYCHRCCMYGNKCPSASEQANRDCWADCERTFLSDCVDKLDSGCRRNCESKCPNYCVANCEPICQDQCLTECDNYQGCELACNAIDFSASCGESCLGNCNTAHQNPEGYSYGRPTDLQHNLLRVFDGNGRLFLENIYGTDVLSADFDRVITQRFGHLTSSYTFYDLTQPELNIADEDRSLVAEQPQTVGICLHAETCVVNSVNPNVNLEPLLPVGPVVGPIRPFELPEVAARPMLENGSPWTFLADRIESAVQTFELDAFQKVQLDPNLSRGPMVIVQPMTLVPTLTNHLHDAPTSPLTVTEGPATFLPLRAMPGEPPTILPRLARSEDVAVVQQDRPAQRSLFSGLRGQYFDGLYAAIDQLRLHMTDPGSDDQTVYENWVRDREEFNTQLNTEWFRIAEALRGYDFAQNSLSPPQEQGNDSSCTRVEETDEYLEGPVYSNRGRWQEISGAVVARTGDGHVWTYYTDKMGNVVRQVNHDTGWKVDRNFDEYGRLRGVLHAHGNRTCIEYDDNWNMVSRTHLPNRSHWTELDQIKESFLWAPHGRLRQIYFADPSEPQISYHWDNKGRLESIEDSQGTIASYQHDDRGRVTGATLRNGLIISVDSFDDTSGFWEQRTVRGSPGESHVATAQWDQRGFPALVENGLGRQEWFDFGPNGVLENHSFRLDGPEPVVSVDYHYDSAGDLSTVAYTADGVLERTVELATNLVGLLEHTETRADGRIVHDCYRYDATHDLVEVVRADGSRVRFERDARGNVTGVERGFWEASEEAWDDECLDPGRSATAETVASAVYAPSGLVEQFQRGGQSPVQLRHDGYGRLAESSIEGVVRYRQGLDGRNRVIWQATLMPEAVPLAVGWTPLSTSRDVARFEEFRYDEHDRLVHWAHRNWHLRDPHSGARRTLRDSVEERLVYDDIAGTVRHVDAIGVATNYRHNRLGRLLAVEYSDGSALRRDYSSPRQFSESTSFANDAGILTRQVTLTAWGEPRVIGDSQAQPLAMLQYDPWGRVAAHTTGAESRRWQRDSAGRVVEQWLVDDQGNGELEGLVAYDGLSRPEYVEDANGNVTQYVYGYEGTRQTVTVTHPDGNQETMWLQSGSDRVEQIRRRNGDEVNVEYDDYGAVAALRFTSIGAGAEWSGWSEVSFDRNPYGLWRVVSTNRPGTSADDIVIERTVDSRGLVAREDHSDSRQPAVSYEYDARGLVETIGRTGPSDRYSSRWSTTGPLRLRWPRTCGEPTVGVGYPGFLDLLH